MYKMNYVLSDITFLCHKMSFTADVLHIILKGLHSLYTQKNNEVIAISKLFTKLKNYEISPLLPEEGACIDDIFFSVPKFVLHGLRKSLAAFYICAQIVICERKSQFF